jgi:3-methyladenine DNA glycosylase AlkD
MLREVGKRCDRALLRDFLTLHAATLPRTTLRYAIEHFDAAERRRWMAVGKKK